MRHELRQVVESQSHSPRVAAAASDLETLLEERLRRCEISVLASQGSSDMQRLGLGRRI
jgi:hypothetical protein